MITLGSKVQDTITGFTGVAVSRTQYLFGCVRVGIEPQEMKDGKPIEGLYFDEQRLVELSEKTGYEVNEPNNVRSARQSDKADQPGGPGDAPPERRVPGARGDPR